MIYKSTSCKTVIAKLYRDLRLNTNQYDTSFIEWMAEALSHIGASAQLVNKAQRVDIKNYRAQLPCDLQLILAVTTCPTDSEFYISNYEYNPYDFADSFTRILPGAVPLQYGSKIFNYGMHCENSINENATSSSTYTVDLDYIRTSFAEGKVVIFYKAIPVDEEGYPLVPDDISFMEALFWYCMKQMLLGGYEHPSFNYDKADAKWQTYVTQARNSGLVPDLPQAEMLINQWTRLVPNITARDNMYESLGKRENLIR